MDAVVPSDASGLAQVIERARVLFDDGDVAAAHMLAAGAYDQAKAAAAYASRFHAGERLINKARRLQGDALLIEARAKIQLADQWDAAQAAGEASKGGRPKKTVPSENGFTAKDAGLSRKEIHEARKLAEAEKKNPGIVERAIAGRVEQGLEPTRKNLRVAIGTDGEEGQGRRENDFYPTPESLIAEIVARWRPRSDVIWEPCVGDGRVADAFLDAGFEVIAGDIATGQNFFESLPPPPDVALCTNPPFGRVREFIDHAFDLGISEMCLVLPERIWASGVGREQFERHRPAVWVNLDWREDYLGKGGSADRALAVAIWDGPCAANCEFEVWTRVDREDAQR